MINSLELFDIQTWEHWQHFFTLAVKMNNLAGDHSTGRRKIKYEKYE